MPVNCGSSQSPSARCVRASHATARSTARPRSPAASSASSAQAVCDAVESPSPGAPSVGVGAQVLAEAAVGVLHRLEPAHRAADREVVGGSARRDQRGHHGARAVEVVRAPAPEPRAVRLLLAQQPRDARCCTRGSSRVALEREHLDHVRGDVGATADRSPRRSRRTAARGTARACCRRRTPRSRRRDDCMPQRPRDRARRARPRARRRRACAPRAARGSPRRCRRCRDSGRCRTRTPSRSASSCGRRTVQSPGMRTSSRSVHSAARASAGWSGATPASRSAIIASAVSQTGD